MTGVVIGTYQILKKLGEGGMGAVYLGQHALLGRHAAIKVLRPELSARPDIVNRFFHEARALTTIRDPGIVQIFDFGFQTDGSAYIVMELLEGEPLDRRLARMRKLPLAAALRLSRQIASSLAAAHAQRIIHRDLKPENIFLVRDAEVASGERSKLLDFGLAKLSDAHPGSPKTYAGAVMGTPFYMSPEQCRGLGELDHRADIYALGCVLFQLITGRLPFEGEGMGDILAAHLREAPRAPSTLAPEIGPALDALVLRCLAKAPGERFQTMQELAAAIEQLLPYVPSAESPTSYVHVGPAGDTPAGSAPSWPPPFVVQSAHAPSPTTLGRDRERLAADGRPRRPWARWTRAAVVAFVAISAGVAALRGGHARQAARSQDAGFAITRTLGRATTEASPDAGRAVGAPARATEQRTGVPASTEVDTAGSSSAVQTVPASALAPRAPEPATAFADGRASPSVTAPAAAADSIEATALVAARPVAAEARREPSTYARVPAHRDVGAAQASGSLSTTGRRAATAAAAPNAGAASSAPAARDGGSRSASALAARTAGSLASTLRAARVAAPERIHRPR